jgi:tripartite-type tricarboxylate transporter receptor subunit TctC
MQHWRLLVCTGSFFLCLAGSIVAEPFARAETTGPSWPQRPVHFIVPLGAGSGVDITARVFADRLAEKWGQPVIVENRPGGDAFIAITAVLGAHDDHVLLFAPVSTFSAHSYLHDKLPYDPNDLTPIARVANTLIGLGVPTTLGVSNLKELVAKVQAAPGKLNYASVTGANDLLFTAFLKTENLQMARVPYKNAVEAIKDVADTRVHAFIAAYAIMRAQVEAGKVKVIALTNRQHAESLNDIPTVAEAGYKSLEFDGLNGILGPRSIPREARDRIAADIREIAADPKIESKLSALGQVVNPGTADEFREAMEDQLKTVKRVGDTLGITPASNETLGSRPAQ